MGTLLDIFTTEWLVQQPESKLPPKVPQSPIVAAVYSILAVSTPVGPTKLAQCNIILCVRYFSLLQRKQFEYVRPRETITCDR